MDPEIALCMLAYQQRQPDANDRAHRVMKTLLREASLLRISRRPEAKAEAEGVSKSIKRLAWVMQEGSKLQLGPSDEGPTTELLDKIRKGRSGDPLLRLFALDKVSAEQLRYAREIAGIVYSSTKALSCKIGRLPVKTDSSDADPGTRARSVAETIEWMGMLRAYVYLPWADRVKRDMPLILALVVEGESLNAAKKRAGVGYTAALDRVRSALTLYGRIRRRYLRVGPQATDRLPGRAPPLSREEPRRSLR
jgi:hypothetical protein